MTDREFAFLREHFCGDELEKAIKRVEDGEPLAYVIGEWYFWDETFKLNEGCLVPRPDTEHVVDKALKLVCDGDKIADICCGSGCIGISILKHSGATGTLVDISDKALEATRENAENIGVLDRCTILKCDITKEVPFENESLDIIVSNPPYIRTEVVDTLSVQVSHEPRIALDGGKDGMTFYRILKEKFLPCIKKGGHMILEIGYDQREDIMDLFSNCQIYRDFGGNDRVAVIEKTE